MAIAPTYPGVYIDEIPSGVHTIIGVSTSIAAFLGFFERGPMNKAGHVFGPADVERQYGVPLSSSEAGYGLQQFFLNGGTEAYVIRVAAGTSPQAAAIDLQDSAGGTSILQATAISPGAWGNNIRLDVDYATADPTASFNLTVSQVSVAGGTIQEISKETFTDLVMDKSKTAYALTAVNGASELIRLAVVGTPAATVRPAQNGTISSSPLTEPPPPALGGASLDVSLNDGDAVTVTMPTAAPTTLASLTTVLQDQIRKVTGLENATVSLLGSAATQQFLQVKAGTANPRDIVHLGNNAATALGLDAAARTNVQQYQLGASQAAGAQALPVVDTNPAPSPGIDGSPQAAAIGLISSAGGASILQATAANEGAWGNNIRLDVDYATTDPAVGFNLTVSEVLDTGGGRTQVVSRETFRNLVMDPASASYAVAVVNDGSNLVRVTVVGSPPAMSRPAQTGTVSNLLTAVPSGLKSANLDVSLNDGTTAHLVMPATAPTTLAGLATTLQGLIRTAGGLSNATVSLLGSASTKQFLQVKAGTPNPSDIVMLGNDAAHKLGLDKTTWTNVQQYQLGTGQAAGAQALPVVSGTSTPLPGTDGKPPDASALLGDRLAKTGMFALEDVDIFNILCIPDTMLIADTAAAAVAAAAETYCQERRAFYLFDVPEPTANPRDQVQEISDYLDKNGTLRHRNAALYYPRPLIADQLNNFRLRPVAASGTMAGVYARIDSTRGVWKAPAGTEAILQGAQDLEYRLTDRENGTLNPMAINCFRTFPAYGNVAWGARTLDGSDQEASEWKYIPVRRLALYLEESLYRGTAWVVFEPNSEPLWASIRLNVGAFMQSLFLKGAFAGAAPKDAYFVKCDKDTTTQNDINSGVVNILVGFAPLKPAEFVIIQIQQIAGQIAT